MRYRVRVPGPNGDIVLDSENIEDARARAHVNRFSLAGSLVAAPAVAREKRERPVSMDPRAIQVREAARRYRERLRGES